MCMMLAGQSKANVAGVIVSAPENGVLEDYALSPKGKLEAVKASTVQLFISAFLIPPLSLSLVLPPSFALSLSCSLALSLSCSCSSPIRASFPAPC